MAAPVISTKRLAIGKANAQVVAVVAVAAIVVVFCLIATKAVIGQNQYYSRLTTAKEKAHRQLQTNISAYGQLKTSYEKFESAPTNVLGGSSSGSSDKDGTNSKLVLDALPSAYDFPAVASSIEKVLLDNGMSITSIKGVDDQIAQQANGATAEPQAVPMPFSFTVANVTFDSAYKLATVLEKSIRPIQIDKITIGDADKTGKGTLSIEAHTYYQPSKNVDIKKQVQK